MGGGETLGREREKQGGRGRDLGRESEKQGGRDLGRERPRG